MIKVEDIPIERGENDSGRYLSGTVALTAKHRISLETPEQVKFIGDHIRRSIKRELYGEIRNRLAAIHYELAKQNIDIPEDLEALLNELT